MKDITCGAMFFVRQAKERERSMALKKDRVLRRIRIIIDVVNVILSVAVVALTVYTFFDAHNRMYIFPNIFYLGALINAITGIKHMISDKKLQGVAVFVFAAVLVAAGLFCGRIVGANF